MADPRKAERHAEVQGLVDRVADESFVLQDLGMCTDGRALSYEGPARDLPRITKAETIWLLGDRVLGELRITGSGHDGKGWFRRLVDVDTSTGDFVMASASGLGEGSHETNVFAEDFYLGTDGVVLRQLCNELREARWQLMTSEENINLEKTGLQAAG